MNLKGAESDHERAVRNGLVLDRRRFLGVGASMFPAAMPRVTGIVARWLRMPEHQVDVVHTRVFAAGPGGGNPCPVIPEADLLTDAEMQTLARQFGLDTAFILRPEKADADMRIRYFVPDHEMGVSGHATIAAVTVALSRTIPPSDHLKVQTLNGVFDVAWTRHGNGYSVTLEQNEPLFGSIIATDLVARVLRIRSDQIVLAKSPIQVVSVSRPKLMVPLHDWQLLDRMKPDFEGLWNLCDAEGVTGLYPFTRHTNKKNVWAEARQFPLRAGFEEDAATGVAAAALGAYLTRYDLAYQTGHHAFRIAQGYAMGAPSVIEAIADCAAGKITRTAIQGAAQIVTRDRVYIRN